MFGSADFYFIDAVVWTTSQRWLNAARHWYLWNVTKLWCHQRTTWTLHLVSPLESHQMAKAREWRHKWEKKDTRIKALAFSYIESWVLLIWKFLCIFWGMKNWQNGVSDSLDRFSSKISTVLRFAHNLLRFSLCSSHREWIYIRPA